MADAVTALQERLQPLLPGLMGMQLTEVGPDRIVATMLVRPDLCTTGGILHGGAHMAFADTLGAVGTFVNLPEGKGTTTVESSTKFIGSAKAGQHRHRREHAAAQGPHDDGLADAHPQRRRQAVRGGHADPAGAGLMPQTAPYGSWKSPLSAERAVAAGLGLGDVSFDGDRVLWQESRPAEKGRNVVMQRSADGTLQELNPAPWNARTRVHEYGGRAYLMDRGVLFFSHFADQRLYRVDPGQPPRPITPEAVALRYADLCADARRGLLWCVREDHRAGGEPRNCLVALQAQGDADGGRVVVESHDFYAAPRLSPDGTQLAWLSWNHPDMPWDGCELWLADVDAQGGLQQPRRLAGSRDEAVQQPQWSPDGRLHFISDRSGWWNLYRWGTQGAEALCPMEAEFGQPFWNFGLSTYAFASATQLVCCPIRRRGAQLAVLDTSSLKLTMLDTPFSSFGNLAADDGRVLFTGASPLQAASVCLLQLDDGRLRDPAPRQHARRRPGLHLAARSHRVRLPPVARLRMPSSTRRATATSRRRPARSRRCW